MSDFLNDAQLIALSIVFGSLVVAWAIVNLAGQIARQLRGADSMAKNLATMRRIMRENQNETRELAIRMTEAIDGIAAAEKPAPKKTETVAPTFGRTTPRI